MTGCCGRTSPLLKSAAFLVLLAFVLQLLGFAIPLWSSRSGSNEGLWEQCAGIACATVIGSPLGGQAWFIAVQVLLTVALVVAFCLLILTFVLIFDFACSASRCLRIAAIVKVCFLVALLLISLIVYWIKGFIFFSILGFKLDFSWYITLVALIIFIIAMILLCIEFNEEQADTCDDHCDDPKSVTAEEPPATTTPSEGS